MRRIRICIYGGTSLEPMPHQFVSELAHALIESMNAVIVTGGFRPSFEKPRAISTDVAALTGARQYANEQDLEVRDFAVVTISGKVHTELVVEQALEVGVPVFPIPDAGGDSKALLAKYRSRIAAAFAPGALETCVRSVSSCIQARPREAALAVVELIRTARLGRCLVLLP